MEAESFIVPAARRSERRQSKKPRPGRAWGSGMRQTRRSWVPGLGWKGPGMKRLPGRSGARRRWPCELPAHLPGPSLVAESILELSVLTDSRL